MAALLLAPVPAALGQHGLTGRVVTELGIGVPFAVVRSQSTPLSVLTGMDGYFTWPAREYAITIDHPDYVPKVYLSGPDPAPHDTVFFYLSNPQQLSSDLSAQASGRNIMARLMSRKKEFNPANFNFSYSAYHKLTVSAIRLQAPGILRKVAGRFFRIFQEFSHSTPHLFMMESVTERTFVPGRVDREDILATNATGVSQTSLLTPSTTLQPFNVFSNYLEIPSFRFVSPLADNTFKRYRFSLVDSVQIDSAWLYRIAFKPKPRRNFDGVEGLLYIDARTLVLRAVSGRESRKTALPLLFSQTFQQQPEGAVFPQQLRIRFELITASKSRTAYVAELTTTLQNLSVAPVKELPEFNPVLLSSRLSVDRDDSAYWNKFRGASFTPEDQQTYIMYDSLGDRRKLNQSVQFAEKISTGLLPVYLFDINLYRLLRYNEHEGFRPGLELVTNNDLSRVIRLGGYGGYGLNDQEWKWNASAGVRLHRRTDTWLSVSRSKHVEEAGMPEFDFPIHQFSSEWLRNLRVRKMDQIRSSSVQVQSHILRDARVKVQLSEVERKALFDYEFLPLPQGVYRYTEASIGLRYAYREQFVETANQRHSAGSRYPILSVQLGRGIRNLGQGELDYWKADAKLAYRVRLLGLGISSFQVIGGKVTGLVPYGLLFNGKGSLRIPSVVIHNSFETMRYNEFLSDQYAAVFFSHQFGKLLIRWKGFEPTFELLHNMGIGSLRSPGNHAGLDAKEMRKGYFESGFFINDLIAFRVYLLKSSIGSGLMFRYGPYGFNGFKENAYYKLSLGIGI